MSSVLIVDDNRVDREGICDLMNWQDLGVERVELAVDGIDGVAKALSMQPDIVIADIDMPEMDGLGMIRKIKADLPHTSCLIMSCFDEFDYAKSAIDLDVSAYLLKPVELDEMTREIRLVLQDRRKRSEELTELCELRDRVALSVPVLQEQFVRDVANHRIIDSGTIAQRSGLLGIESGDGHFLVIYASIHDSDGDFSSRAADERYRIVEGIRQCLRESMGSLGRFLLVENLQDDTYGVAYVPSRNERVALNRCVESAERTRAETERRFGVDLTVGISSTADQICRLPELVEEADLAANSRFYTGGNGIVLSSDVPLSRDQRAHPDLGGLRIELTAMIERAQEAELDAKVLCLFDTISGLSEPEVRGAIGLLLEFVQQDLKVSRKDKPELGDAGSSAWETINQFETIGEIRDWTVGYLRALRSSVQSPSCGKYERIVSDIRKIVQDEYPTIQNIDQIADQLQISTGYANSLFKKHTGETIFEYLVRTRVEAAKLLLRDPYARVYEVSEQVGYRSSSYFRAVFKSHTGRTPRQYVTEYAE